MRTAGSHARSPSRSTSGTAVAPHSVAPLAAAPASATRAKNDRREAELEHRVRERTAELESANRNLDAFAASVSHDLRTPIRRIAGFLSVLEEMLHDRLEPEESRILEVLAENTREMSEIVRSLLVVARANRIEMSMRSIDLGAMAVQVIDAATGVLDGRQIRIEVQPLPCIVGDVTLVREVLENLVSNAIKYTRMREIATIEIGCSGRSADRAMLFVRDNGVGFEMADAGRLFGMFQRLHSADEFEGTGVGLATVRRILERHGCTIVPESFPDVGTTFHFTLPLSLPPRN